ncbi:hypothetical protein Btru_020962 [Bulinus truncatus]|nr:hypothetical protein Btru_020962 [Bulinus truncatus]
MVLFNLLLYRCSTETRGRQHEGRPHFKPPGHESYPPHTRVLYYLPDTPATRQFMSRGSDSSTRPSDVLDDQSLMVKLYFDDQSTVPKRLRFHVITRRPYSTHKVFDTMTGNVERNQKPVYNLFTTCLHPAYNLSITCLQHVYNLSTSYQQPVYNLVTNCLQPITSSLQPVYNLSTNCLQPVYNLSTTCLPPVYNQSTTFLNLSTTCLHPVYNLSTTCLQPVYILLTTCQQSVYNLFRLLADRDNHTFKSDILFEIVHLVIFLPPPTDRLDSKVFAAQYIVTRIFINYWTSKGHRGDSCNHSRLTAADEDGDGVEDGQAVTTVVTSHVLFNVTEVELSDDFNSHDRFIRLVFPFFFIGLVCFTAQALIQDKKSGAKYLMTHNDLRAVTYWVSWFVPSFAIGSFTGLLFALAYSLDFDSPGGITLRRPFLVTGFMILYAVDTISFSFMVACFVKKTRHSFIIGGTVFIIARFTAPLLQRHITSRYAVHLMGCLVYQTAVVLFDLLMVEDRRLNGQIYGLYILYAFYEPLSEMTLLDPFIMLLTNTFFNLSVMYYMENVQSGQRSLLKHWLFLMKSRLYLPEEFALYLQNLRKDSDMFEPTTPLLIPSIKLRNVRKVYISDVVLDIAKLDAFQDEITVILGLNGAGKTTTLNMIAGLERPSEGTIVVNGYDISKNPKKVAECIAVCPDEKLFMTKLTCREHLQVYTMLQKGSSQSSKKATESLLKSIGMERFSDTYTNSLSPGQRRKLCIAVAFTGHKRVVLLDDPFCGLDPEARRDIWQFLKAKRLFRTVLLTTESTDDAQAVGDRILVMSHGVIKSKGAPEAINKLSGCSFKLNIIRSEDCDVKAVTAVITRHIHDAKISEKTESTLQFLIPDRRASKLPELLRELESKQESLNINYFDVLSTSIKDSWLGVQPLPDSPAKSSTSTDKGEGSSQAPTTRRKKEDSENQDGVPVHLSKSSLQESDAEKLQKLVEYERLSGSKQWFRQIKVIMSMKSVVFVRNRYSSVMILSIPVAYTLLGMVLDSQSKPVPRSDPEFFTEGSLPPSLSSSSSLGMMFPVLRDNQTNSSVMTSYVDLVRRHGGVVYFHMRLTHTLESSLNAPLQWLMDTYSPEQLVNQIPYSVAHILRQDESEQLAVYCFTTSWRDKPVLFQLLASAWVRCALGEDFSVQSGVQFDGGAEQTRRPQPWNNGTVLFSVIFMALIPLPFVYSLILEEKHGSKRLQILNGVNPWLYWLGQLLFDLTYYGIMVIPHLVALFFTSEHDWWILSVWVISVYGLTMFSYLYALQFFFRQPATGVSFVLTVNVFIGILGALVLKCDLFHEDGTLLQGENFCLDIMCRLATPSYELTFFLQLAGRC